MAWPVMITGLLVGLAAVVSLAYTLLAIVDLRKAGLPAWPYIIVCALGFPLGAIALLLVIAGVVAAGRP